METTQNSYLNQSKRRWTAQEYQKILKPRTVYPFSRLQLFERLKIPPKSYEKAFDRYQCIQIIKDQLFDMERFGYDFYFSSKKRPQNNLTMPFRRKVKLRLFCQRCNKPWTSIVGTVYIKFQFQDYLQNKLVNFRLNIFRMKCENCMQWGVPRVYESQIITVAKIFCLVIAEMSQNFKPPFRPKDDRSKFDEEVHHHKEELCEACSRGKCFARPKPATLKLLA